MNIIYMLVNRLNWKVYIGVTNALERRMRHHSIGSSTSIGRAVKKYGWNNFDIHVLSETNDRELEKFYIRLFNSRNPHCGYNLTDGGEGIVGFKHSPKSIEKMRQAKIGKKSSVETKARQSKAHTGLKHSNEAKQKISENNRRRKPVKHTKESKEKISNSLPKKTYSFIDPIGNVNTTSNISEFCKEHSLNRDTMYRLYSGTYPRSSYKGWAVSHR